MLENFNLVVATYRARENDAISELWFFASEVGDKSLDASKTGLPSLIVARTSLDPEELTSKMRERILQNPWLFRYILKVTPVQLTVPADLESVKEAALRLAAERLGQGETYKVEVHIRLSELKREDVIAAIAENVKNKVSLEAPDKIIVVEVIGDVAGVGVVRPSSIVSVEKLRREARRAKRGERLEAESEEGGLGPQNAE